MFIRKRKIPLTLQKLDTLIPRLASSCKQLQYIRQDATKLQKGYNGERRLDYHLQSLSNVFYILSDVGLKLYNREFQIDSLVISPHAMYLIETKNFEGTLTFDTIHRQMLQSNNNQEKSFTYPLTQADPQRRSKIASTIMAHVQDFSVNVMEKYQLTKEDINPGTRCSSCSQLNMTYNHGKWTCPDCGETNKYAHITTLQDYFLLINNKITIKEAQRFLKLPDRYQTYRILKKTKLKYNKKLKSWSFDS